MRAWGQGARQRGRLGRRRRRRGARPVRFQQGGPSRFYLNNGNGTFRDATEEAGLEDSGYCMGSVFGDVNNDGKPDLYLAKGDGTRSSRTG